MRCCWTEGVAPWMVAREVFRGRVEEAGAESGLSE